MHKAPRRLELRALPVEPALTPSNCSRSPRRWSRPCRSRRSSPRKGASSRGRRRGALPSPSSRRGAGRSALPACLLPSSLPFWAREGAAAAATRSAPRGSFPRRSRDRPQEPAPATPPRAGGATSPASRASAPTAPPGSASLGSAWPAIGWGGGAGPRSSLLAVSLLPRRGNAAAHLAFGSCARAGEAAASVSARLLTPLGQHADVGAAGEGLEGRAPDLGFRPSSSPPAPSLAGKLLFCV